MAVASATDLEPVANVTKRLKSLLKRSRTIKPNETVEPPLPNAELAADVDALHDDFDSRYDQSYRFSAVETAARQLFYIWISSTDIRDPAFVEVWNLLDILLLCADRGRCTPELVCWFIEELLDSQTTHGCRVVFDYLESRRERLARKDFHKKNLVFLRSCNELLRRLSRAEDAIFCGRVFFFLFQTFPLGDKSSVNLRGEFHVENTTKYEVPEPASEENAEPMEVDVSTGNGAETPQKETSAPPTKPESKAVSIKTPSKKVEEEVLSNNDLYPIFWRLQQDFSDPTRLFVTENFSHFKSGLSDTLTKFKKTPTVVQAKAHGDRGLKRKLREDGPEGDATSEESEENFVDKYNPKYLTSRDLFDLELSDMAFQRHILVQSLILIDFLLSLTEKAKKRLATLEAPNKSLLYAFTLSEEDAKWVIACRSTITTYMSSTLEGKLFNRMVETVLARDKNWIRWKVEGCPSIVKDPVSADTEIEARKGIQSATRVRRVPDKPTGAMDLSFLEEGRGGGLDTLKDAARFTAPSIDQLVTGISTDELDLEMAMDDEEKMGLENAVANKRWRILRQARASRLGLLDKVEPAKSLELVFNESVEAEAEEQNTDVAVETEPSATNGEKVESSDLSAAATKENVATANETTLEEANTNGEGGATT